MKPAILVVDDDTTVCELLQDVLNEHVFSCACGVKSKLTLISRC